MLALLMRPRSMSTRLSVEVEPWPILTMPSCLWRSHTVESRNVVALAAGPVAAAEVVAAVQLVGGADVVVVDAELIGEAGGQARADLGVARQAPAREDVATVTDVHVRLATVVPPHDLMANVTRDLQRNFPVALADGRGLELGNPLLEISAAITAKVSGLGLAGAVEAGGGDDRHCASRLQQSPIHINSPD